MSKIGFDFPDPEGGRVISANTLVEGDEVIGIGFVKDINVNLETEKISVLFDNGHTSVYDAWDNVVIRA